MDKTILVEEDISSGRSLIQALDRAGFPVVAALWNYLPEEGIWRLLIASPKVNERGPLATYEAIQEVLLRLPGGVPLHQISAVSPEDPFVTELRIFAGTDPAPFIGSTYLRSAAIGDGYVEKAYIYRAERIVGKTGSFELWSVTPDRAHKAWMARRCQVDVEDGFFKEIHVEGFDWPQSQAKNGINAHLGVLINPEHRGAQTFGDVVRWTIFGGRLRSIETLARGVRIEGFQETSSSMNAAS
jgi:hypothetical protein